MEISKSEARDKIIQLALLGVIGGFIVPGLFYYFFLSTVETYQYLLTKVLLLTFGGGTITLGLLLWASLKYQKNVNQALVKIYLAGLISVIIVLWIVHLSGTLQSPFLGLFLYVPAIVALIVQQQLPVIAAAAGSIIALIVLTQLWGIDQLNFLRFITQTSGGNIIIANLPYYKEFYFAVFICQLVCTTTIALMTVIPKSIVFKGSSNSWGASYSITKSQSFYYDSLSINPINTDLISRNKHKMKYIIVQSGNLLNQGDVDLQYYMESSKDIKHVKFKQQNEKINLTLKWQDDKINADIEEESTDEIELTRYKDDSDKKSMTEIMKSFVINKQ